MRPKHAFPLLMLSVLLLSSCSVYRERNWVGTEVTQARIADRVTYLLPRDSLQMVRLDSMTMDSTGLRGQLALGETSSTSKPARMHVGERKWAKVRRATAVVELKGPLTDVVIAEGRAHIAPEQVEKIRTDRKDVKKSQKRTLILIGSIVAVFVFLSVLAARFKPRDYSIRGPLFGI